ncbi:MAG: hypothetical protein ACRD4O_01070, partial [Bryobacteraceae bacterium]
GLLQKIAKRESETARARDNYTYRQSVTIQELNDQGLVTGTYHEITDITYTPSQGQFDKVIGHPTNTLTRIKLTAQDFSDIRNVDPFLLTLGTLPLYEGKYWGEGKMDDYSCWIEHVQPKQILAGQRFFKGTFWVRKSDFSVIRSEGQAVPQIETTKEQNLFPHFTTMRRDIEGWFFPVETYADDTLFFRAWPQRIRIVIRYSNYKRFGSESTVTYGPAAPAQPPTKTPNK